MVKLNGKYLDVGSTAMLRAELNQERQRTQAVAFREAGWKAAIMALLRHTGEDRFVFPVAVLEDMQTGFVLMASAVAIPPPEGEGEPKPGMMLTIAPKPPPEAKPALRIVGPDGNPPDDPS